MSFFKHVGKVNNKKVIIVKRSIGGDEAHMAVVIYSDIMPQKYHDDVMKILESNEGQQAYEFSDILERRVMSDGQNMLQALSHENYLKRVPANNVLITPNSKSSMRLDELNKLLAQVGKGDEAVKRLERMENQQGYADPAKTANTDAFVSENASLADLGIDIAAENAKLAPAPIAQPTTTAQPDMTAVMMEMMKTMQSMQQQLNELKSNKPVVVKSTKKAPAKTVKTKTSV
jgi:hypothetical protein